MNIVTSALAEALETMAFMEILPIEEELSASRDLLWAEITFVGSQKGSIQILAGREFAEMLAENIAALDEVTEADCRDAIKELVNVTCGLIIPVVASDISDAFDLNIPAISHDACTPKWQEFILDEDTSVLNVEQHLIAAKLTMHEFTVE